MAIKREEFSASSTHKGKRFEASLNSDNLGLVIDHLVRNYTNPDLAVLREWVSNAHDAHVEAGVNKPVEVAIPTKLSPSLVVRDYGAGMSQDHVQNIYSCFHNTSKEGNQDVAGGIGIGGKSALALSPQYVMTSVHEGLKSVYMFERDNAVGMSVAILVDNVPTDEPSGVEVSVQVKNVSEFSIQNINWVLAGWNHEQLVIVSGLPSDMQREALVDLEMEEYEEGFLVKSVARRWNHYSWQLTMRVVIGCVNYSVDVSRDLLEEHLDGEDLSLIRAHSNGALGIYVKPGVLTLPSSREVIELSSGNLKVLTTKAVKLIREVNEEIEKRIAKAADHAEAIKIAKKSESFIWSGGRDSNVKYKGSIIPYPNHYKAKDDGLIASFIAQTEWNSDLFRVSKSSNQVCDTSFFFVFDEHVSEEVVRARFRIYLEDKKIFKASPRVSSATVIALHKDYSPWVDAIRSPNSVVLRQAELDALKASPAARSSGGGMSKSGSVIDRASSIRLEVVTHNLDSAILDYPKDDFPIAAVETSTTLGQLMSAIPDDVHIYLDAGTLSRWTHVHALKECKELGEDSKRIGGYVSISFRTSRTKIATLNTGWPDRFSDFSALRREISRLKTMKAVNTIPEAGVRIFSDNSLSYSSSSFRLALREARVASAIGKKRVEEIVKACDFYQDISSEIEDCVSGLEVVKKSQRDTHFERLIFRNVLGNGSYLSDSAVNLVVTAIETIYAAAPVVTRQDIVDNLSK